MVVKRSGKDRRVNNNRRKGGASTYNGPEKRAIKYQRSGNDRRQKDYQEIEDPDNTAISPRTNRT